jgi:hypothetical protein
MARKRLPVKRKYITLDFEDFKTICSAPDLPTTVNSVRDYFFSMGGITKEDFDKAMYHYYHEVKDTYHHEGQPEPKIVDIFEVVLAAADAYYKIVCACFNKYELYPNYRRETISVLIDAKAYKYILESPWLEDFIDFFLLTFPKHKLGFLANDFLKIINCLEILKETIYDKEYPEDDDDDDYEDED